MSRIVSSAAPLSARSVIKVCRLSCQRPVTPRSLQGHIGRVGFVRPRFAERENVHRDRFHAFRAYRAAIALTSSGLPHRSQLWARPPATLQRFPRTFSSTSRRGVAGRADLPDWRLRCHLRAVFANDWETSGVGTAPLSERSVITLETLRGSPCMHEVN